MATRKRTQQAHPSPILLNALKCFSDFGMKIGDRIRMVDGFAEFHKGSLRIVRRTGIDVSAFVDGGLLLNAIEGATEQLVFVADTESLTISKGELSTRIPAFELPRDSSGIPVGIRKGVFRAPLKTTVLDTLTSVAEVTKKLKGTLVIENGYVYGLRSRTLAIRGDLPSLACPQFEFSAADVVRLKKVSAPLAGVGSGSGIAFFFGASAEDPNATIVDLGAPSSHVLPAPALFETECHDESHADFWRVVKELDALEDDALLEFDGLGTASLICSSVSAQRTIPIHAIGNYRTSDLLAVRPLAASLHFDVQALTFRSSNVVGVIASTKVGTVD